MAFTEKEKAVNMKLLSCLLPWNKGSENNKNLLKSHHISTSAVPSCPHKKPLLGQLWLYSLWALSIKGTFAACPISSGRVVTYAAFNVIFVNGNFCEIKNCFLLHSYLLTFQFLETRRLLWNTISLSYSGLEVTTRSFFLRICEV